MTKFYAKIGLNGLIESTIESDNEQLSDTLVELSENPNWSNKPSPFHKPYYKNGQMVWNANSEDIRQYRNNLLSQTDWTQLPDVPKSISEIWKDYRQALRDLPQQSGFPDIDFPKPPQA